MKFCYNNFFTLPKPSQRSRSVLQDGSRALGLFWKEKTPSYNRRNTVVKTQAFDVSGVPEDTVANMVRNRTFYTEIRRIETDGNTQPSL